MSEAIYFVVLKGPRGIYPFAERQIFPKPLFCEGLPTVPCNAGSFGSARQSRGGSPFAANADLTATESF
jgi:hypothetical protein